MFSGCQGNPSQNVKDSPIYNFHWDSPTSGGVKSTLPPEVMFSTNETTNLVNKVVLVEVEGFYCDDGKCGK